MLDRSKMNFLIFIVMLTVLGQIAIEIYLPALPKITASLNTDTHLSQLSVSAYLLGLALPCILFGYISDFVGRKKILLLGLYISLLGSVVCIFTHSIYTLIIARFIEGVGFSAVVGIGRSMLRDQFSGVEFAKYLSYLGMAMSIAIDLSPFVGGFLQLLWGWRVIFVFIFVLSLINLPITYKYNDKFVPSQNKFSFINLIETIIIVLKNWDFLRYNLICAIQYGIFMSYLTVTSFITQQVLGKSVAWYGLFAMAVSIIYAAACYFNTKLLRYFKLQSLVCVGKYVLVISAAIFVICGIMNYVSVLVMYLGAGFICIGAGISLANADALAFSNIKENVGTAAALSYSMKIFFGMGLTAIISNFSPFTTLPLGILLLVSVIAMGFLDCKQTQPCA